MDSRDFPFLSSRRIIITGGTGFLGKHLTRKLEALKPPAMLSAGRRELNLLDTEAVDCCFDGLRPQIIFHLAAVVGGIGANQREPGRFFRENLLMGLNLMEAARRHGVEKVVLVGTVCAYPKFTAVPFREDDLWQGYPEETNAPYGLAKKMLLVQAQAYRRQYGVNSIYLLPANLYGPGDHIDIHDSHVIPAVIRKVWTAVAGGEQRVNLWGTGEATREFLFVKDAADALLLAAEKYNQDAPVNLGTGLELSIRELVEKVASLLNFRGQLVWDPSMPDGQPRRCLDVSRARAEFSFFARTPFDDGLKETVSDIVARLVDEQAHSVPRSDIKTTNSTQEMVHA